MKPLQRRMTTRFGINQIRGCWQALAVLLLLLFSAFVPVSQRSAHAQVSDEVSVRTDDFEVASVQGFGDRANTWAWAMQWWNGYLYVGTNRSFRCVETASLNYLLPPLSQYPPLDADIECADNAEDLPLQAEIWRWSPKTDLWQRVFQSPANVRLASRSDKLVARDIGFRGMTVFTEPDGTEALYATAVGIATVGFALLENTPTRILRSTDGVNFEPIPQDPGTTFGDLTFGSYRNPLSYRGRFYVVGSPLQGSGVLLESNDPARGNNSFRKVSPAEISVSAIQVFDEFLYVGIRDTATGYSVVKTNALGTLPYHLTPVVEEGGYLKTDTNTEILSLVVFKNALYAGGNGITIGPLGLGGPAELIRIHPDDTWDLVVGTPRLTPQGWKDTLSRMPPGFGNQLNGHMWRMAVYRDQLYVGTFDSSTLFKDDSERAFELEPQMGFDLYTTANGTDFAPITTNGFGDRFSYGLRTMASTPYGLFIGTANPYYGLQIWRTAKFTAYFPTIAQGANAQSSAAPSAGQAPDGAMDN